AQGAAGRSEIAPCADQVAEAEQRARRDAVSARYRFVGPWFRPLRQAFVIVRGEEESAVLAVFEACEQGVGELDRPGDVAIAPGALQAFEQRVEQECVVVQ